MPLARLERESCSANDAARPATLRTARREEVSTPKLPATTMTVMKRRRIFVKERVRPWRLLSSLERPKILSCPFKMSFVTSRHTASSTAAVTHLVREMEFKNFCSAVRFFSTSAVSAMMADSSMGTSLGGNGGRG